MAKKKRSKKGKRSFNTNWKKSVRRDSERQQQSQSSYGFLKLPQGVSIFNATPGGRHRLDIMPYIVTDEKHPDRYDDENIAVPDSLWYKRPFSIHRNIGAEKDAVVCPRSSGKQCPICEYKEKRLREGAEYETVKDLKISKRNLYVVIPKRSKDYDEKPHIWEMSQFLFQNLLNQELEEDEDNLVFPDLENGKTLKIRFDSSKIGDGNPFPEASRIDFIDRKEPYDESILDEIPNLDECLEILSYSQLEAKFMELGDSDVATDDEFEDDEDFDEDFEDEDEFEEEPEPEPAPKRKKKSAKPKKKKKSKKKKKPEPEPEPEDEFEDEFEEELDEDFEEEFEEEFEEDWDEFEDEFDEEFED